MLNTYETPNHVRYRPPIMNSSLKYLLPPNLPPHHNLTPRRKKDGQTNSLAFSLGPWVGLSKSAALQACSCVQRGSFSNVCFLSLGPPHLLFPQGQFNLSYQIAESDLPFPTPSFHCPSCHSIGSRSNCSALQLCLLSYAMLSTKFLLYFNQHCKAICGTRSLLPLFVLLCISIKFDYLGR